VAVTGLAVLGAGGGAAVAQDQSTGADLSISLTSNLAHPRTGHTVYFTVTVKDLGPASQTGMVITLSVHNGLRKPKLVAASLDTSFVPPACHAAHGTLTCTYRSYQLAPPPNSNPIKLTVKATTGVARHETAVAKVSGSADPNPANNRAARTLLLRGGRTR